MDNVGQKETLREYFLMHKDISNEAISNIFYQLDSQLKYFHQRNYHIKGINSDTIVHDNGNFIFTSIEKSQDIVSDRHEDIINLSKLAIGTYISIETGFCDYTNLDIDYVKSYFGELKWLINDSEYYEDVIMNNDTSTYYVDYVQSLNHSTKGNSRQIVKATPQGKLYSYDDQEDAAFVKIMFYPIMIICLVAIVFVISCFWR